MKTSRKDLDKPTAVPAQYDSFFSFPKSKGGYSGVAVYYDPAFAIAHKVEEGLAGTLQPKPPLTSEERISSSYPHALELPLLEDETGALPTSLDVLDSEGRALVLDFGLFVLINVYCPNDASDARMIFKMNWHFMLEERVRILIAEGRQVIVVGDINVVAALIDHGEGTLESKKHGFFDPPHRAWFQRWLAPNGPMHDAIRGYWPGREGMYTCWNTKISARDSNYGTRIDYILVTSGLLPWIKHGDIQAHIRGSDHCPVYIDLHDEIISPTTGERLVLKELLGAKDTFGERQTSRIAAKFWDEFSGKQTLLSSFFSRNGTAPVAVKVTTPATSSQSTNAEASPTSNISLSNHQPLSVPGPSSVGETSTLLPASFELLEQPSNPSTHLSSSQPQASSRSRPLKRKQTSISDLSSPLTPKTASKEPASTPSSAPGRVKAKSETTPTNAKKSKKAEVGQSKLSAFFSQPTSTATSSKSPLANVKETKTPVKDKRKNKERGNDDASSEVKPTKRKVTSASGSMDVEVLSVPSDSDTATEGESPMKMPGPSRPSAIAHSQSLSTIISNTDEDEYPLPANTLTYTDTDIQKQLDDDYAYALSLAENSADPFVGSQSSSSPQTFHSQSHQESREEQKEAWSRLTAPLEPPRCSVHDEPAKTFKVNKPGPNKGKMFFLCSRPVGPGYDAGKSVRLRSEVDHQYRCDFFKWASDVRKEQNKGK